MKKYFLYAVWNILFTILDLLRSVMMSKMMLLPMRMLIKQKKRMTIIYVKLVMALMLPSMSKLMMSRRMMTMTRMIVMLSRTMISIMIKMMMMLTALK